MSRMKNISPPVPHTRAQIARAWFFLFRPWSFTATLAPFLAAAGLVAGRAGCHWGNWALGFLSGIFFQATVNLLNTWGDEKSGVDGAPGAIRTTPQVHEGFVKLEYVLRAGAGSAFCAAICGLLACFYRSPGGWHFNVPLLVTGLVGAVGATNYATLLRFKYLGLGVAFSGFFMGAVEFFAAFFLLTPSGAPAFWGLSPLAALPFAAAPLVLLIGVILHGNDMRDMPSDRAAGIRTFALTAGPKGALLYYFFAHAAAYAVPLALAVSVSPWGLLPFACAPLTVRTMRTALRVYRENPDLPQWRGLERASGGILTVFALLYALALFLLP